MNHMRKSQLTNTESLVESVVVEIAFSTDGGHFSTGPGEDFTSILFATQTPVCIPHVGVGVHFDRSHVRYWTKTVELKGILVTFVRLVGARKSGQWYYLKQK